MGDMYATCYFFPMYICLHLENGWSYALLMDFSDRMYSSGYKQLIFVIIIGILFLKYCRSMG